MDNNNNWCRQTAQTQTNPIKKQNENENEKKERGPNKQSGSWWGREGASNGSKIPIFGAIWVPFSVSKGALLQIGDFFLFLFFLR